MPSSYDYAIIRVVPRVERGEHVNVGLVLFCRTQRFLEARIAMDPSRVAALDPALDLAEVEENLAVFPLICRGAAEGGAIADLPLAERFHWLVAPRSTVIQVSAVHSGLCDEPAATLTRLLASMVGVPSPAEATRPDTV